MPKLVTIDDETEFTNLIEGYFTPRGFEVFSANEGTGGLELIRRERPEICLIDLKMPGIHGDEVLRQALEFDPSIKCIMITASEGGGKTRDKLLQMGAYKCFDKPISSLKDLEKAIQEAVLL
ncbi:MAG: Sporulation initiation phosphotransferase F [Candidatus Omnitrophica bacterium]|nr:Sporulation initiation phosphotransferase F [Candidatus Omnitrophota bacterium]